MIGRREAFLCRLPINGSRVMDRAVHAVRRMRVEIALFAHDTELIYIRRVIAHNEGGNTLRWKLQIHRYSVFKVKTFICPHTDRRDFSGLGSKQISHGVDRIRPHIRHRPGPEPILGAMVLPTHNLGETRIKEMHSSDLSITDCLNST